jgi:hypothetical protein
MVFYISGIFHNRRRRRRRSCLSIGAKRIFLCGSVKSTFATCLHRQLCESGRQFFTPMLRLSSLRIPIMGRGLLHYVPLLVILAHFARDIVAWSPNSGFSEPSLERRAFIANVGGSATAATVGRLFFGPQSAYAKEPISTDPATFDTYNVIPDASARLDPKLQKIDVSNPKIKCCCRDWSLTMITAAIRFSWSSLHLRSS